MNLTPEQLERIARWQSASTGFDRDDGTTVELRILPAIAQLTSSGRWHVGVDRDGGMENFYSISVRKNEHIRPTIQNAYPRASGLLVYLSLICPLAAVARTEILTPDDSPCDSWMKLDDVFSPEDDPDEMVRELVEAFGSHGFIFTSRDALSQPLPRNVAIDGYSSRLEPEDRLFHLLFHMND
jgi:hypothetical protein